MRVKKAFRYRLYPSSDQERALTVQFGHARFTYNWGLATRKEHYRDIGKDLPFYALKRRLTRLKSNPDHQWLSDADSQVLQASLENLDRAFVNFFCRRARYPTFKSKRERQSIRYPQRFKFSPNRTYLPKVGWVKTVFHRPIEGTPKNVTAEKTKSGKYYISVCCEVEMDEPPPHLGGPVGIDLGISHFAVLSTEEKIESPRHLRKAEKRLKRLQRQHSRKQEGSTNREKSRLKLPRAHEEVGHKRRDFLHKLSRRLVASHDLIKIESLNVAGMVKNHSLAKSISDSGWAEFGRQLEYKGRWYGSRVERIASFYPSSKTCHGCGEVNEKLTLSDRKWECPECGALHDRDLNAAAVIRYAPSINSTDGVSGIDACGEVASTGEGQLLQQAASQKQEAQE